MDITRWLEEERRDLLFLVQEAYGETMIKQYQSPLQVGVSVKVVGDEYAGQIGELRVIDSEADEGDCFGVYLDAPETIVFFRADEIKKVEPEEKLFDEAVARATALGRPFIDVEVFGFIWQQGIELVPQMDARFVLFREATRKTRRLWRVVDMAELPF